MTVALKLCDKFHATMLAYGDFAFFRQLKIAFKLTTQKLLRDKTVLGHLFLPSSTPYLISSSDNRTDNGHLFSIIKYFLTVADSLNFKIFVLPQQL